MDLSLYLNDILVTIFLQLSQVSVVSGNLKGMLKKIKIPEYLLGPRLMGKKVCLDSWMSWI